VPEVLFAGQSMFITVAIQTALNSYFGEVLVDVSTVE
jgi:hypothetical protein